MSTPDKTIGGDDKDMQNRFKREEASRLLRSDASILLGLKVIPRNIRFAL